MAANNRSNELQNMNLKDLTNLCKGLGLKIKPTLIVINGINTNIKYGHPFNGNTLKFLVGFLEETNNNFGPPNYPTVQQGDSKDKLDNLNEESPVLYGQFARNNPYVKKILYSLCKTPESKYDETYWEMITTYLYLYVWPSNSLVKYRELPGRVDEFIKNNHKYFNTTFTNEIIKTEIKKIKSNTQ